MMACQQDRSPRAGRGASGPGRHRRDGDRQGRGRPAAMRRLMERPRFLPRCGLHPPPPRRAGPGWPSPAAGQRESSTSWPDGSPSIVANSSRIRLRRVYLTSRPVRRCGLLRRAHGLVLEDGLAVDGEPVAQAGEALALDLRQRPIGHGSHVEQQVPVLAHDVDEMMDQLRHRQMVVRPLELVVPERVADAARGLPLARRQSVVRRILGRRVVEVPRGGGVDELSRAGHVVGQLLAPTDR